MLCVGTLPVLGLYMYMIQVEILTYDHVYVCVM